MYFIKRLIIKQNNRKGLPKNIQISESTRTGNKVVTTIRGLESYGMNPNDLIEPLQKLCASSVSGNNI